MIIEFTGIPCSGKSDISHALAEKLRSQGFSVCEKQYNLSHAGNSAKRKMKKLAACFLYGLKHPIASVRYYHLLGSLRLFTNYLFLLSHKCKKDICILEQGYLQFVGSVFDNTEPDAEKMAFLVERLVPQKEIISVFVSVSKACVLERASKREDKPFFIQSEDKETALARSIATNNLLHNLWCQSSGEARSVSVSNEEDDAQEVVAQKVLDILKQKELL